MFPLREACPGEMLPFEERQVDWEPLLALAPDHVDDFMWMFMVELKTGLRVHAYKHRETRRYIYLDAEGRAFGWAGESMYCEVDPEQILDLVLNPPPPDPSEVISA